MTIEIGPTYINPYDPGAPGGYSLDAGWTSQYDNLPSQQAEIEMMQAAARNMLLNGDGVCDAAATGNSLTVMSEAFKGLSNQSELAVRQQLKVHCDVNQHLLGYYANYSGSPYYIGDNQGSHIEPAYGNILVNAAPINYIPPFQSYAIDFYGTPSMALSAIGYWLWGGGQPRNVHIQSLNLQMEARDFQPIAALLNDPTFVGSQIIDAPFSYNTFSKGAVNLPAAGMLGRVSGNVQGTLEIQPDGTYFFIGSFTLNSDYYDADVSNRTWGQEALTTFLKGLGDAFGHTDYYINILGSQSVQFTGTR